MISDEMLTQAAQEYEQALLGALPETVPAHTFSKTFQKKMARLCRKTKHSSAYTAFKRVACAVILPKDCDILYLNDSKKLTAAKREELYDVIMEKAVAVGIGMASPQRIDEINILQATYEAMRQAISNLNVKPAVLLNDAVTIPEVDIPQIPIIKGDAKSVSIAAASIIAKVTRDRMMVEYDRIYPGYDLASNKGYGTKVHMEALKTVGPCEIHRRTFIKNIV